MGNINTVGPNEALVISGSYSCLYRGPVLVCGRASVASVYLLQQGVCICTVDPPPPAINMGKGRHIK